MWKYRPRLTTRISLGGGLGPGVTGVRMRQMLRSVCSSGSWSREIPFGNRQAYPNPALPTNEVSQPILGCTRVAHTRRELKNLLLSSSGKKKWIPVAWPWGNPFLPRAQEELKSPSVKEGLYLLPHPKVDSIFLIPGSSSPPTNSSHHFLWEAYRDIFKGILRVREVV